MTCKISRHVMGKDPVVLHISGRIAGADVNMLRDLLKQENAALIIDLKNVHVVDADGVKLLAVLESNGARINNCPLYIREWIRREREAS